MILPTRTIRDKFIKEMERLNIAAHIGYIPLHSSKMGKQLGYDYNDIPLTEELAGRIVRMPIYTGMSEDEFQFATNSAGIILTKLLA